MRLLVFVFLILALSGVSPLKAESALLNADSVYVLNPEQFQSLSDSILSSSSIGFAEKSLWLTKGMNFLKRVTRENRKITAAVLTVTLGMLGIHRLYLGTKPWVPAVYLFTFGGCFFILPFIDLVVILFSDDMTRFEENGRLFMWTKQN